ncbi:MAG: carbohydrate ABC transporter permease [Spirochaetales bacterium]|nr:carbohydrate ABC transporter permease [Spirochaetales bacterium]
MRTNKGVFNGFSYIILIILTLPIILGYLWIIISTFSTRCYGLIPVDQSGNYFKGLTLANWTFLTDKTKTLQVSIWLLTANTLVIAVGLTVGVVIISMMAGYALSRIKFPGRKPFLSLTLILHSFPSVSLLIAIYFVLRWIAKIPVLGRGIPIIGGFGYNTLGGVILVSISLQLPLGIWLMKGFFDNVSWDLERAALIDGCSRWRAWWQIMVPQIMPGIAALSIFSFMEGWKSFLIPYSFMTSHAKATLSTLLNEMLSESSPVDYGTLAAVGLFQLLPVIVFYIFTQKYLLNIFSGGVKGTA